MSDRRLVGEAFGVDVLGASIVMLSVLAISDNLNFSFFNQIGQADIAQELVNLLTEIGPEMVCQALFTVLAIALILASGCIQRLMYRIYDFGYKELIIATGQTIAPTRTSHANHQMLTAQLSKKLLKVRQRYPLPAGDVCQAHRPLVKVERQIKHGGDGVPASRG
jgi:hypothetical protein